MTVKLKLKLILFWQLTFEQKFSPYKSNIQATVRVSLCVV